METVVLIDGQPTSKTVTNGNKNKGIHKCEDCGEYFKRRGQRKYPDKCASCAKRANMYETLNRKKEKTK